MSVSAVGYIWMAPEEALNAELVERETQKLRAYCQANTIDLMDVCVEDAVSGNALERPALSALLQLPQAVVVVPSLASLGRRFHDVAVVIGEVNNRDIRLIAIEEEIDTERSEGQQLLRFFIKVPQVARMMRHPVKERPRTFVRSREVLHNGGTCPYGYVLNEATNQYQVMPLEGNVVKRIFRERLSGRSLRQIANDLTRDGIATKRGGRWQANTVKTILENVFYTGAYQCQNRLYPNDHEAVITEELFHQVNSHTDIVQMA